ncbi:L-seryl-tRNA selenium transferase [Paenibacillus stellifer]|uniref:TVP38/TMEM64 family membrane protein n=1 Tax=Paenibacillus stellifer TaxID=169760 RepID=A0A089LX63_9BACL|nr:VTT domain-containing protein [Paenibacillus stellifer]AIQ65482.1 L-seryl-tRNA selenium transferase [Paenibacillus stellifer]
MTDAINSWVEWLLGYLGLSGPEILLVTIPLAVFQSLIGLIPFILLIVLHVSVFHIIGGMLVTWLIGTLAGLIVFALFRRYLFQWFETRWSRKLRRYDKWQRYLNRYGIWTIVLLRTLPIVPNNIINIMAAVSPVSLSAFIWGTLLGNLSFIWLFGTISSSLIVPREQWSFYLTGYGLFLAVMIAVFIWKHWGHLQEDRRERMI